MKKIGLFFASVLGSALLIGLIWYAQPVGQSVQHGVELCLYTLVPSLFAFMILSSFFVSTGLLDRLLAPFGRLCGKLFHIDKGLGPVLFMSLIGGYPVGARLIATMVEQHRLQREDAERLICYCFNSGPAFLIGGVAMAFYRNFLLGLAMFGCHLLSFFLIGILTGIRKQPFAVEPATSKNNLAVSLVDAVHGAARSMVSICGFVLLFSAMIGLVQATGWLDGIAALLQRWVSPAVTQVMLIGWWEVTNGCILSKEIPGILGPVLTVALTAFGGLAVHGQVRAMVNRAGIRLKRFFLWRLAAGGMSAAMLGLLLLGNHQILEVFTSPGGLESNPFSFSPISSILLLILAFLVLLSDKKSVTIKRQTIKRSGSGQSAKTIR